MLLAAVPKKCKGPQKMQGKGRNMLQEGHKMVILYFI